MTQYQSKARRGVFSPPHVGTAASSHAEKEGQKKINDLERQMGLMYRRDAEYLAVMQAKHRAEEDNRRDIHQFEKESDKLVQNAVQRNFQKRIENAQVVGEQNKTIFDTLSSLSATAAEQSINIMAKKQDEVYEEWFNKALNPGLYGKEGEEEERRQDEEFNRGEAAQNYIAADVNDKAAGALEMGVPAIQVREDYPNSIARRGHLSGLATNHARSTSLYLQGQDFPDREFPDLSKGAAKGATTTFAKEISKGNYSSAFAIQDAVVAAVGKQLTTAGLGPAALRKYFLSKINPQVDRIRSQIYASANQVAERAIEIEAGITAQNMLDTLPQGTDSLATYLLSAGGNPAVAMDKFLSFFTERVSNNTLQDPETTVRNFFETQMGEFGGKEMSYAESLGSTPAYLDLMKLSQEVSRQQKDDDIKRLEASANAEVQQWYTVGKSEGGRFSRTDLRDAKNSLKKYAEQGVNTDKQLKQLELLYQNSNPQFKQIEIANEQLQKAYDEGDLDVPLIESYGLPLSVADNWLKMIEENKSSSGKQLNKVAKDTIADQINGMSGGTSTTNRTHYSFVTAKQKAFEMYLDFRSSLGGGGASEAEMHDSALKQTIAAVQKGIGPFYLEKDTDKIQNIANNMHFFPLLTIGGHAGAPSAALKNNGREIRERIIRDPTLLKTEQVLSQYNLEDIASRIESRKSFAMPEMIVELAKGLHRTESDVLNEVLTSKGYEARSTAVQYEAPPPELNRPMAEALSKNYDANGINTLAIMGGNIPARIRMGANGGMDVKTIASNLASGVPEIFVALNGFKSDNYSMPIKPGKGENSVGQLIANQMLDLGITGDLTYGEALEKVPQEMRVFVKNHLESQNINLNGRKVDGRSYSGSSATIRQIRMERYYKARGSSLEAYHRAELSDPENSLDQLARKEDDPWDPHQFTSTEIASTSTRGLIPKHKRDKFFNSPESKQADESLARVAETAYGMNTSLGPDNGRNACAWSLNQVFKKAGIQVPWLKKNGKPMVYVPNIKRELDRVGYQLKGPRPGAIAIMNDNYHDPALAFPHIGIVQDDGRTILSNSSGKARFSWRGSPSAYTNYYGGTILYYTIQQLRSKDNE